MNEDLASAFSLISAYYTLAGDANRARAYNRASSTIKNSDFLITSGQEAAGVFDGIGPSMAADIDQWLNNGHIINRQVELETRLSEQKQVLDLFMSVYGIGPASAVGFYQAGHRTLEDLWFRANLNDKQRLGLQWKHHIDLRIERWEIDLIATHLGRILPDVRWEIAGSYRRGEPTSGDIDLLVMSDNGVNMPSVLARLEPYLPVELARGETKFMGLFRLSEQYNAHRIDIRLVDRSSWGCALMYFTGSQRYNILMRRRAMEVGYTLNEYSLTYRQTTQMPVHSEEDICNILQVRYLPPTERTRDIPYLLTPNGTPI
jgi:DNA polymerase/3'-5' exonuclease PolX